MSASPAPVSAAASSDAVPLSERPEGFQRVAAALAGAGHSRAPMWLDTPARTCAEAAAALGVQEGQIAKSVIFRRRSDERAVLVVASGDRRVDTAKVAALVGEIGRADAAFVKARTGFSIGGVSPLAHLEPPVLLLDEQLGRFDAIWAAAGHPHGVFCATLAELQRLTAAPLADVTEAPPAVSAVPSPCTGVCRMNAATGCCQGCWRTLDEIAAWSRMDDAAKTQVLQRLTQRRGPAAGPEGPAG